MTVFRTLVAGAQLVLFLSFACVLLWFMAVAFILLVLLVPEETQAATLGIVTLTFVALSLIALVLAAAKGMWRWIRARRHRT
jgi:hypothetical protein